MKNTYRSIFLLLVLFLLDCSSSLLKQEDYLPSRRALENNSPKEAIQVFPRGETNGFITTMEKTYLNLIQGKPDIKPLLDYSYKVEKRLRFSASRELKTFFYISTPEGYYASEHEIIWMHLLLSWGFSLKQEYEKAFTEAKIASNLLSNHWSEEGRFDDAMLRVVLASLWAMCGHWEEAQVDFRVAYNIQPTLKWAEQLAALPEPPAELFIVLGGTGPEPKWDPSLGVNPIRSMRNIGFVFNYSKKNLVVVDKDEKSFPLETSTDSANWYKRHFIRDNEIHDLIKDSEYGQVVFAKAVQGTTISILGITSGLAIGAAGVGAGGGLIYLAARYGSSSSLEAAVAIGITLIGWGVVAGYEVASQSVKYSIDDAKDAMDKSEEYRFVRFLPDITYIGWSNSELKEPLVLKDSSKEITKIKPVGKKGKTKVSLLFYPSK